MGYYNKEHLWVVCPVINTSSQYSVTWPNDDRIITSITDNMGEVRWFSEREADIYAAGLNAPELLVKMIKQHEGYFESVIDERRAAAILRPFRGVINSIDLHRLEQAIVSAEYSIYCGINLNGGVPLNKEAGEIFLKERIGIAILDLKTALGDDIFEQLVNNEDLELEFCCLVDMVYNMGLTSFWKFVKMIAALKKAIPLGRNIAWSEVAKQAKDSDWWRKNSKARQRIPHMFQDGEWIEVE